MDETKINLSNEITRKVIELLRKVDTIDEAYLWQFLPLEIDKILEGQVTELT